MLVHPHYDRQFILDTDASATGIGAVLSQLHDDGNEHVIAYGSRTLSKPERRYCVTRRELLAVVTFIHHFRPYLLGQKFSLRTDHSSITWLRSSEGQLARWIMNLQEYDFSISHRQGKKYNNADALSRRPCPQCERTDHPVLVLPTTSTSRPPKHSPTPPGDPDPTATQQVAATALLPVSITRDSQLNDSSIGVILTAVESGTKLPEKELKSRSQ